MPQRDMLLATGLLAAVAASGASSDPAVIRARARDRLRNARTQKLIDDTASGFLSDYQAEILCRMVKPGRPLRSCNGYTIGGEILHYESCRELERHGYIIGTKAKHGYIYSLSEKALEWLASSKNMAEGSKESTDG